MCLARNPDQLQLQGGQQAAAQLSESRSYVLKHNIIGSIHLCVDKQWTWQGTHVLAAGIARLDALCHTAAAAQVMLLLPPRLKGCRNGGRSC